MAPAWTYGLQYRPEIDGLRAWAVVLIILFHAKISTFGGGFIGVDVFFVISGFLITRIIAQQASEGQFSLLRFYERRIRRIIPVLCVVIVATLLVGAVLALPLSLERMSHSAAAALLFYANIHFWIESNNYFAPNAETDPFLHTWSLAVEEQFYIVFPIFIALLFKYAPRWLRPLCIAAALLSLLISQIGVEIAPTAAFYLSPPRAWEFLTGSLLALNAAPRIHDATINSVLAVLGLGLIVTFAVIASPTMGFPGINAIPPVLGAAFVIHAAHGNLWAPVRACLTAPPILFIGLISYSLYLWHWPALVFTEHFLLARPLTIWEAVLVIAVAFGMACLSYFFVEQPFRRGAMFRAPSHMLAGIGTIIGVAAVLIGIGIFFDGLAGRHPGLTDVSMSTQLAQEKLARDQSLKSCSEARVQGHRGEVCILSEGDRELGGIFLWGDSFAGHYAPALTLAAADQLVSVIGFTSSQCPPVINYNPRQLPACPAINQRALKEISRRNVKTVVLAANWFSYLNIDRLDYADIADTAETLRALGKRVLIVGQSPIFHFVSPEEAFYRHLQLNGTKKLAVAAQGASPTINVELRRLADLFVDPLDILCNTREFCPFHNAEGYLVTDYGHLSVIGAMPIAREILAVAARDRTS